VLQQGLVKDGLHPLRNLVRVIDLDAFMVERRDPLCEAPAVRALG